MSCTDVTRVTEERRDCGHLTGRRCHQGVVRATVVTAQVDVVAAKVCCGQRTSAGGEF